MSGILLKERSPESVRDIQKALKPLDSGLRTAGMTDRRIEFIHRHYLHSILGFIEPYPSEGGGLPIQ